MSKVVAVRKDEKGKITDYKLETGEILDATEAISAVESGKIEGCMISESRDGDTFIRSKRGQADYKLSDLPEF